MGRLFVFGVVIGLVGFAFGGSYSGGSGTAGDPYLIGTAEDLVALGGDPNDYNKHFIMTGDIDFWGYSFSSAVTDKCWIGSAPQP